MSHLAAFTSATAYRGLACEQLQCLRTVADGCGWLRSAKKHSERTRLRPPPPRAAKLNKNSYTHSGKAKTHLQGLRQPSDKVPASKRFQRKTLGRAGKLQQGMVPERLHQEVPAGGHGSSKARDSKMFHTSKIPASFPENSRKISVPARFRQCSSKVPAWFWRFHKLCCFPRHAADAASRPAR